MDGQSNKLGGHWYMHPNAIRILEALPDIEDETKQYVGDILSKGYCVIPSAIPEAIIQNCVDKYLVFKKKAMPMVPLDEAGKYRRIVNLHCVVPEMADLFVANKPALKVLDVLFQSEATLYTSLFFEIGSAQALHRDTPYFWTNPAYNYFGMWVGLEKVDAENGALVVLEGSHLIKEEDRAGIARMFYDDPSKVPALADQRPVSEYNLRVLIQGEELGLKRVEVHVNAGDTIIWHPQTMHGGSQIKDKARSRMSQPMHITPPNTPVYHNQAFFNPNYRMAESSQANYVTRSGRRYMKHGGISFEGSPQQYRFTKWDFAEDLYGKTMSRLWKLRERLA